MYQNDFSQMNIIPVTEGKIRSLIRSVKAKDFIVLYLFIQNIIHVTVDSSVCNIF